VRERGGGGGGGHTSSGRSRGAQVAGGCKLLRSGDADIVGRGEGWVVVPL